MYAMQYEITLPADYDMKIIRHRVATRGRALDAFPGLGLKAYLIRERGINGSPVNQYAPFYLWASIEGMNRFLWGGGGFHGIVNDFGRPPVQHWTGVACEPGAGPAAAALPRAATRHIEPIPAGADLAAVVDRELGELQQRARSSGVHSTALAIDPRHWELMHFTLWNHANPEAAGTHYQVLHLSTPQLSDIAKGRHW